MKTHAFVWIVASLALAGGACGSRMVRMTSAGAVTTPRSASPPESRDAARTARRPSRASELEPAPRPLDGSGAETAEAEPPAEPLEGAAALEPSPDDTSAESTFAESTPEVVDPEPTRSQRRQRRRRRHR